MIGENIVGHLLYGIPRWNCPYIARGLSAIVAAQWGVKFDQHVRFMTTALWLICWLHYSPYKAKSLPLHMQLEIWRVESGVSLHVWKNNTKYQQITHLLLPLSEMNRTRDLKSEEKGLLARGRLRKRTQMWNFLFESNSVTSLLFINLSFSFFAACFSFVYVRLVWRLGGNHFRTTFQLQ